MDVGSAVSPTGDVSRKLRIGIFTAGEWSFHQFALARKVADDPHHHLVAIVVDQYHRSLRQRLKFLLRVWGVRKFVASLVYAIFRFALRVLQKPAMLWHDRFSPPTHSGASIDAFAAENGIELIRVPNLNAEGALEKLAPLNLDIGLIMGGRILKPHVINLPRLGTLNIHKHDVARYRGGPEIGYPELLNGDDSLGVTIHRAVAEVDAGAVVATASVPIQKFDTIDSLTLKANCASIDLYPRAVRDSQREGAVAAYHPLGPVLYSTPWIDRILQTTAIDARRRQFARAETTLGLSPARLRLARSLRGAATLAAMPYLKRVREKREAAGTAPVTMLYYHGVGNAAENWMTLDLVSFHRQVEYLTRYFDVISLAEAVAALRSGRNTRPSAVLTFDDGYASIADELAPYLFARGLPATFFVCAAAADGGHSLKHDEQRGFGRVPLMNAQAWRHLADQGFEIGCHGFDHEDMATLDLQQLQHALIDSADLIAGRIGRPVRYFSFPFGAKRNISAAALQVAARRFDAVFSAYGGYNIPGVNGPFHFTRFSNPADIASLFAIMNGLHRTAIFYSDPEPLGASVEKAAS